MRSRLLLVTLLAGPAGAVLDPSFGPHVLSADFSAEGVLLTAGRTSEVDG